MKIIIIYRWRVIPDNNEAPKIVSEEAIKEVFFLEFFVLKLIENLKLFWIFKEPKQLEEKQLVEKQPMEKQTVDKQLVKKQIVEKQPVEKKPEEIQPMEEEPDKESIDESIDEDISNEAYAQRHERGLNEERKKFLTFLKFPYSTR